jgi:Domain of unknown function (DUF6265)
LTQIFIRRFPKAALQGAAFLFLRFQAQAGLLVCIGRDRRVRFCLMDSMRAPAWFQLRLGWLALLVLGLASVVRVASAPVDQLAWLAGTWSFERNGRTVTEHWLAPAGGTMLGVSRTIAGGRTIEYEFIVLRADESGQISYLAKPSGQPEAVFKLVRTSATDVVFENLAHDFPQRISYALQPDGSLLAAIEGTHNGQARRVEFPYRRVTK